MYITYRGIDMEEIETRYFKVKIPPEKKEMRQFFKLVEVARKEKIDYFVVMTPDMFERLKTEKMIYDKMKGEKDE